MKERYRMANIKDGEMVACCLCGKERYYSQSGLRNTEEGRRFCSIECAQNFRKQTRQAFAKCVVCDAGMTGLDLKRFWGAEKKDGLCLTCHNKKKADADEERKKRSIEKSYTRKRKGVCLVCGIDGFFAYSSRCCVECHDKRLDEYKEMVYERWYRSRRQDPKKHLHDAVSHSVRQCLNGAKNRRKTFAILGYSVDTLKRHLEKLFLPGMTWDNYGRNGWHLDHIVPINVHNFARPEDPDFKRLWALSNLQPLWEADNIRKSDTFDGPFQPCLMTG